MIIISTSSFTLHVTIICHGKYVILFGRCRHVNYYIIWLLLRWVFYFFRDVIEIVPTIVRPQSRVKRRRHVTHACGRVFEIIPKVFGTSLNDFVYTPGDHHENSYQLRSRKRVLHSGGQVYAVAVYVRDNHWINK